MVWNLHHVRKPRAIHLRIEGVFRLVGLYGKHTLLLTSTLPGVVHFVDLARGKLLRSIQCYSHELLGITLSADGAKLVTTGTDEKVATNGSSISSASIRIWDLEKTAPIGELPIDDAKGRIELSPDGRCLATLRDGETTRGCGNGGSGNRIWYGKSHTALSVLHSLRSGQPFARSAGSRPGPRPSWRFRRTADSPQHSETVAL